MRVQPSAARWKLREGPTGLSIVIPARRNWFLIVFLSAWLVGWGVGEVTAVTTLATGARHAGGPLSLVGWLVAWTVFGAGAGFAVLWSLAGREVVAVEGDALAIRRKVGRLSRSKEFDLAEVEDVRVSPQPFNPFQPGASLQWLGISGGTVAFDYGSRTYRFGASLDEAEARRLVEAIRERLGSRAVAAREWGVAASSETVRPPPTSGSRR